MLRELRGEVGDRAPAHLRKRVGPPGVLRLPRIVERGDGGVVEAQELRLARGGFQRLAGQRPQHPDRVVRGRPPQRVVEPAEHEASRAIPAPPEIHRQIFEARDPVGELGAAGIVSHGVHAPTSDANFARSILPPDTTATVLPAPARPLSAAAMAQPAAPSAMMWLRSATSFIARATSSSVTTIDPESRDSSGHIVGSTDLPPAPSTNDAFHCSKYFGAPAASDADSGAAVSGSAAYTCADGRSSRITAAMPDSSPPPPSGAITVSTSGRSSRISRPAVALPAMNWSSSNGCTKWPVMRSEPCDSTVRQHSS